MPVARLPGSAANSTPGRTCRESHTQAATPTSSGPSHSASGSNLRRLTRDAGREQTCTPMASMPGRDAAVTRPAGPRISRVGVAGSAGANCPNFGRGVKAEFMGFGLEKCRPIREHNVMSANDFDIHALARYLHLAPQQVAKLADRGKLPGRKVGGQWRFAKADIHHWLERRIGLSDEGELLEVEDVLQRSAPADGRKTESPSPKCSPWRRLPFPWPRGRGTR